MRGRAKSNFARALAIDPDDNAARYNAACALTQMGETKQALDLLDIWVEHVGTEGRRWAKNDPDLDTLRDHPRYKALVKKMR